MASDLFGVEAYINNYNKIDSLKEESEVGGTGLMPILLWYCTCNLL
jgi:hypothetical protein